VLLHPDFGALRTRPLPLLVVDMPLEFLHRDLALPTCHVFRIASALAIHRDLVSKTRWGLAVIDGVKYATSAVQ
jgi:hypothetical protein